jgi:hypothetical protein
MLYSTYRVSFETSFDSKLPKLVSALSETKHLFCCFSSISKQRVSMFRLNRNKQKTNRNSLIGSIFCYFFRKCRVFPVFWFFAVVVLLLFRNREFQCFD